MASKQTAPQKTKLDPLTSIHFVHAEGINEISAESVIIETVGEKAFGLSCLPKPWTLPFIVISDELLARYKSSREDYREHLLNSWANHIIEAVMSVGMGKQEQIIVRSSGYSEGLKERGTFSSVEGTLENIFHLLSDCLKKLSADTGLQEQKIPLVIQKYAVPISAKGHLSNERRCYKEKRDWLGEFEELRTGKDKPFRINLRNWRKRVTVGNLTNEPLLCNLTPQVSEVLKIPAAWGYQLGQRLHFEWVWDGKTIYLVQADQERESKGLDPTEIYISRRSPSSEFMPKCLKKINKDHATKYNKIRNVFTYMKLGLPITQLYVLDNQSVISDLALGKVLPDLEGDLIELVKNSLVIRMDIATRGENSYQLLPRTDGVRELDGALEWLKKRSAEIKKDVDDDVAFIFHNFIPATSSAFALAAPAERKVQIEAIWGLPEGLYYNSHDKYIVDTGSPLGKELRHEDLDRLEIQKKINFKHFFVAPDENDRWTTQIVKPPYDWRPSIKRVDWVKKIALESRRIAEEEGKSLSIMWFIGVPRQVCPSPIFPWYHEPYDPKITSRALTQRTKTPFDKSLIIRRRKDIEVLQQEAEKGQSRVRRVRIQPLEDALLRDKNTLRQIGELTNKIDAVILLEGGVLSHAYYQLMQTDATVEVLRPFEDLEDKREFDKLVRDDVPSNIARRGEVVTKTRLSGEFKLRALREKLIEEAFEALDATVQDSIVEELADLSEVIDEILSMLSVSRDELQERQKQKREKAGGFKDGLVLLETRNPPPTEKGVKNDVTLFGDMGHADTRDIIPIHGRKVIELSHAINKWSDRREHQVAEEAILKLVVPMVRDSWTTTAPEMVIESDLGNVVRAKITGKRLGADLQIEISFFIPQKQLKLF
ncbi:MAG: hypothetical protein ACOYU4_00230 [Thermodesulfobacteriota bacterium]